MKNSTALFMNVAVTTLMLLLLYASVTAAMCEYFCYAPAVCKCCCCCCMLPLCANVATAMSKHCCYYVQTLLLLLCVKVAVTLCTVQFNYNFTHARDSTHGNTHFSTCKMPKFAVELIIYARREMLFTRDKTCHLHETCYSHETLSWSAALGEQVRS